MNRILFTFAAAAGLFGAVPAAAQTLLLDIDQSVPMALTMDNPCTPQAEAIAFQGTTQLAQRVWLMPNGKFRLQVSEQTALQGQDAAMLLGTSPTYAVSVGAIYDLEFIPDSVTIWDYQRVTKSAGTPDNFHSVLTIDFDPQTLKINLSLAPACDDGVPH
jgi:hypothetical protein